ncbi:sugar ABC transporter ATP-binding protein [Anaeromyxobacter oryzae]|uniref:Ribose import ATP-binding protein RbsA n=1 Tax=Anaeromyxobacter oryzae TaxID=2918170 RepID=A0ABN6N065_9BACT|nr:sugar ABC transporter ATP-binding protein [Anaeromyxobacter oryzae]BDG05407.1 ribose import ATP-binding protein RbsA [Anaeromyxobacter oryzae]
MGGPPFLSVEGVSKSFGATRALDGVSLSVERGAVLGLAGENGAGKSTLIKILCGVHRPDAGRVLLDGRPHQPRSPAEAEAAGIAVFHQEIPVCPDLSIAANVFLGPRMPRRGLGPDWRAMERRCVELYRTLLGEEIDPRRLVRTCSAAEKQLALLVRVLSRDARLVILDEPTTALAPPEVERLFAIFRRLASQGIAFVFVSHMLEELVQLSDAIAVLRDGRNVGTLARGEFDLGRLSQLIAGRTVVQSGHRSAAEAAEARLEVRDLGQRGGFEGVSFRLGKGEILGIAGLQGSGRAALVRSLFGAPPATEGEIRVDGVPTRIARPQDAIRAGIGFVPEDRHALGLFDDMDVKLNVNMAGLPGFSRRGLLDAGKLRRVAERMRDDLSIKAASVDAPVRSLSGGNQQKVLISRWLALRPRILLMVEPTRGVDVGAKQEIVDLVLALARDGCTCVISSSELEELLRLSNRVLVMSRGRVARELAGAEATKDRIILAATT